MKILALFPTFRPADHDGNVGGGEISNRILLAELARLGHTVRVVTLDAGGARGWKENGVEVFEAGAPGLGVTPGRIAKRLLYTRQADQWVSKLAPDVLLCGSVTVPVALRLASRHGLPAAAFVRAFENLSPASPRRTRARVRAKRLATRVLLGTSGPTAMRELDLLVPNSIFMADRCRELVPHVERRIVYPPLRLPASPMRSSRSVSTISMVGTTPMKGVDVVHALAKVFPDVNFRVIGSPSLAPGEAGVNDNLTTKGWCDAVAEFREHADIALVPSQWDEPFGRVAIEALAAGVIPLVADRGGLPEAVGHERQLIVESTNVEAWADRIRSVMRDPDAFHAAVHRARSHLDRFTAARQASTLEAALVGLVDKRHRPAANGPGNEAATTPQPPAASRTIID